MIGENLEVRFLPEALYPMNSHHRDEIEAALLQRSVDGTRKLRAALAGVQPVFVCFTNRVGSNLFTDLLDQAGFGVRVAEEDFNSASVIDACKMYHMDAFDQYLAYVVDITKKNGTFFCKIGARQLLWLANRGFISDFFPAAKFIFVRRRDKISQAVSLYIADETGRYTSTNGPGTMDAKSLPFNKERIARNLFYIIESEQVFSYFFALHDITPMEVWYEELASKPRLCLSQVARYCNRANEAQFSAIASVDTEKARMQRQRSEVNDFLCSEMRKAFALGYEPTR